MLPLASYYKVLGELKINPKEASMTNHIFLVSYTIQLASFMVWEVKKKKKKQTVNAQKRTLGKNTHSEVSHMKSRLP